MLQGKNLVLARGSLRKLMVLVAMLWSQGQIGECLAQQAPAIRSSLQVPAFGGQGSMWLSPFTNPAILGALFQTPDWPMTGYYPLFPAALLPDVPADGVSLGPLKLNPMMGVAEMYTDNVFRTRGKKVSDFFTTLSPGIQARLPFAERHDFIVDYRTNLQYYQKTPTNDVQDQTASGRFKFDFPGGLKVDLGGEYKLGHDPRGTAVDTRTLEINKWEANSFFGQAEYVGAQSSIRMNVQSTRWQYLNNGQAPIQDRLTNYAGLTFSGDVSSKTALLANVAVTQQNFDENQNMDSAVYQIGGGARWNISELTSGQILIGLQHLQFTNAQVSQPPPVLSQFTRTEDSYNNFFVMGNVFWTPTSLLTISLQPYRTVQQTTVGASLFFVATGVNLGASHMLTDRMTLTLNAGLEQDQFTSASGGTASSSDRTDLLKNISVGAKYRAVKWLGLGCQYMYEDRSSTVHDFAYRANTVMVSAQVLF